MFRPRARVGRADLVVPLVLGALLLALGGCGSDGSHGSDSRKTDEPSKADLTCRAKWKDLESDTDGHDSNANPSALPQRWNTIVATVAYYATSASSSDCGKTLADQRKAMDALTSFGTRLAPYDMELRLEQVRAGAQEYAAGPRPTPPAPSPAAKGDQHKRKQKAAPRAPKPADIAKALELLTTQAPVAAQQQGPGWQQASVAELSDPASVTKTLKDLAFLSSQSPAYRACTAALAQINTALRAAD